MNAVEIALVKDFMDKLERIAKALETLVVLNNSDVEDKEDD